MRKLFAVLAGFASLGCPAAPRRVVYDLAERLPVAERWSPREVVLFGTPAAEPHQAEGFYPPPADTRGDRYLWVKREAVVSFTWPDVAPRAALLDLAPYEGVRGQSAEVSLNGKPLGRVTLNDRRHRYRLSLPPALQRRGENRLGFVFADTASPADRDPASTDRGRLAAAFYSVTIGAEADTSLDDLLRRDAPAPFGVTDTTGVPALALVGPSSVRYAIRLPASAELRFTPALDPAARAAGGAVSLRVTLEEEAHPGQEREIWSRVMRTTGPDLGDQVIPLIGPAGAVVRLGLHAGAAGAHRFAWGVVKGPRVLGTGAADPLETEIRSTEDEARADPLRRSLLGSNVILIILDAARARELGCYGYGRATTPEIDRIAAEGVVFDHAFTPAVHTQGAMASVWTSQEPDRHHGAVSFAAPLPKDRLTLAELLTAQGITTAGFVANAVAGAAFGFERGFSEFHEVYKEYPEIGSRGDVFRKALPGWLETRKSRRFFAYLHYREPHFPYDPAPPFDTRFGREGPISKAARGQSAWIVDVNQGRRPFTPEEREHLVRLYDGNLAFADQEVGWLRRQLEAAGVWERSVVIVAADHGEGLFEHGWIGHNVQVYEPSMHVPLIVRFPATKGPAGTHLKGLVDLLDLAPTIADVFGVLGKGGSDRAFGGKSLLPVVAGAPGKAAVLSRTVWDRPIYALRDTRFKFIYDTRSGEERLYDLVADPNESGAVGSLPNPVRWAYYREALHQWMAKLRQPAPAAGDKRRLSQDECENLKTLGYVVAECQ